jgi:cytochrome c
VGPKHFSSAPRVTLSNQGDISPVLLLRMHGAGRPARRRALTATRMRCNARAWSGARTLDKWLTNPQAFVPGNSMSFPGLKKESTRDDVIAYLKAVSEGKAPQGPDGGGMMGGMMGNSGPANLRQASTDSLVTSLRHCRDTYIIKTAAGATRKVWEYNVRLKTDSSKDGPNPGKPVVTGSGMQGDRVSIVFASHSEVSEFIKESCQ